ARAKRHLHPCAGLARTGSFQKHLTDLKACALQRDEIDPTHENVSAQERRLDDSPEQFRQYIQMLRLNQRDLTLAGRLVSVSQQSRRCFRLNRLLLNDGSVARGPYTKPFDATCLR